LRLLGSELVCQKSRTFPTTFPSVDAGCNQLGRDLISVEKPIIEARDMNFLPLSTGSIAAPRGEYNAAACVIYPFTAKPAKSSY
jgi:hypothetical protein